MKKMILLSIFAVTLTGCVVAPYDDYSPRHDYGHGYDRPVHHHGSGSHRPAVKPGQKPGWGNQRPDWNHDQHRPGRLEPRR